MRIDGVGGSPILPGSLGPAAPAAAPNSAQQITSLVNQALIQEEQKGGGGGGHGGGHGAKKVALDAIDDIAARSTLIIQQNKTMLARTREIEKMQAELAAENEKIGEKDAGEREPSGDDEPDGDAGEDQAPLD
jgi:hypothetical protein